MTSRFVRQIANPGVICQTQSMNYQFTSAAERVLNHAAGWIDPTVSLEVDSRAIVLGLLTETECRAAHLLAERGVTIQEVCALWGVSQGSTLPSNETHVESCPLNRDLKRAIREVYRFVSDFERSPILATEHLLLAVLYSDGETAQWLNDRGATSRSVETDIRARNGYVDTPLDFEEDAEQGRGELGEGRECDADAWEKVAQDQDDVPSLRSTTHDTPPSTSLTFLSPIPSPLTPVFRILDAAANRAREGLRVVEDYFRFVLDDRFLTEMAKQLRHDLVKETKRIPATDLLASRETQADVGTALTTVAESARDDMAGVLTANFARLQESLRSLEEYGKLIDPAMASGFKQIRYRVYTLERTVAITRQSCERLAAAKLYVLIDGRGSLDEFREFASCLIAAGVHVLQLRDKKRDDRELLEYARMLRVLTRGTPTFFIMNDRPDLAALSQADGVHLGQEELTVKDARTILGPQSLIGVSTHTIAQARQAVLDGANYLGVGPTFPSNTKEFNTFPGLDFVRQVAAEIRLPAFAIGGITLENLPEVLSTGIGRVAVSGAVANAENPLAVIASLLSSMSFRTPHQEKYEPFDYCRRHP
jgi:thiamine-phosphate pyrophosphorylase